jgi:hypothetical protein
MIIPTLVVMIMVIANRVMRNRIYLDRKAE